MTTIKKLDTISHFPLDLPKVIATNVPGVKLGESFTPNVESLLMRSGADKIQIGDRAVTAYTWREYGTQIGRYIEVSHLDLADGLECMLGGN